MSTKLRVAGGTHVGAVRTNNEDSFVVDEALGFYAVFDGMGGANAGDVASQTAAATIKAFVASRNRDIAPKSLITAALQAGSAAIFADAQRHHERHGMGTTAVACLVLDANRVMIAHVGDSRAYLLRDGVCRQLTRDHTVVEELVARGALSAEDAERHPYKNVLSRNLGARPDPRVDVTEVTMISGDRLLLCSDGLYGYSSHEAVQYVLGSGDPPQQVCSDLIELALRGGGGDNVSVIVLESAEPLPTATQLVRSSGAIAWWQNRQIYFAAVISRGFAETQVCSQLSEQAAIETYAATLYQAVFHDLEKSSSVNVWTFAQSFATGWLTQHANWPALRAAVDILTDAAQDVIAAINKSDENLAYLLHLAVARSFTVMELAIGGVLSEQLRQTEQQLVDIYSSMPPTAPEPESTNRFLEQPTVPFLRESMNHMPSELTPELVGAIKAVLESSRKRSANHEQVLQCLASIEVVANDPGGGSIAILSARELYGVRTVDEAGISPLFEALERARLLVVTAIGALTVSDTARNNVMRIMSRAHQRLVAACTGLVIEAVSPNSDRLREAQHTTSLLRAQIEKLESKRASLERRFVTSASGQFPWSQ